MGYLKTMNYNFKPLSVRAVLNLWVMTPFGGGNQAFTLQVLAVARLQLGSSHEKFYSQGLL